MKPKTGRRCGSCKKGYPASENKAYCFYFGRVDAKRAETCKKFQNPVNAWSRKIK